jgi:hypothetical protein
MEFVWESIEMQSLMSHKDNNLVNQYQASK